MYVGACAYAHLVCECVCVHVRELVALALVRLNGSHTLPRAGGAAAGNTCFIFS